MIASCSFSLSDLQGSLLHKSNFLGQTHITIPPKTPSKPNSTINLKPTAKFNLFEILGGRGLCNGEEGIEQELKKYNNQPLPSQPPPQPQTPLSTASSKVEGISVPEDAFGKELSGLTGGFPGGEKGLQKFIEENPPPPKTKSSLAVDSDQVGMIMRTKVPDLPLLLPGMIAIVKNPSNPYHMYCGIVQRITDGKAGVLFEGGNWDRLITFRLEELERREKGPPMVNPLSVVLESAVQEKDV